MRKLILAAILFIAFLLRVMLLSEYPVGFTPDEASFGYDAYSLLLTGKDQWGHTFPLVLESFGDYKPPLYSYMLTPFVGTMGLTKAATRLPNALFGVLAVYATYLLAGEVGRLTGIKGKRLELLKLTSAGLLAVSSWHVMMSRGAFEANLTTFFLPLGIYLFLKGLNKPELLKWSALVFGVNLFSYHSAKLVTPLVLAFLTIVFFSKLKKLGKKKLSLPIAIFTVFLTLTAYTFTLGAGDRASDINIFKGVLYEASDNKIALINEGANPVIARLFNNKYQMAVKRFMYNYTQYSSYRFLFKEGPAEATYGMMPGRGVLYWFELPLLVGFFIALVRRKKKLSLWMLLFWMSVAPIPAALTLGAGYSANRAVVMLPAIQIAAAIGVVELVKVISGQFRKPITSFFYAFYLLASLVFVVSFLFDYYYKSPLINGENMLVGRVKAAEWLSENSDTKDIVMSTTLSEPHIYVAFASRWDPKDYQMATKNWNYKELDLGWVDQMPAYTLGNYEFRRIDWKSEDKSDFVVGKPIDFPENVREHADKVFKYPNDKDSVLIFAPEGEAYVKGF